MRVTFVTMSDPNAVPRSFDRNCVYEKPTMGQGGQGPITDVAIKKSDRLSQSYASRFNDHVWLNTLC